MSNKIGIAFVGGGGKGAYQIGVWKALRETGLDKEVKAVAGTSVGGLNAAMFVQGDFFKAERVWKNLSPAQVLNWSLGLESLFSASNLEKLIKNSVDLNCFSKPDMNCWITTWTKENSDKSFTVPDGNGNVEKFTDGNAHYFNMRSYSNDERLKILLASSALPFIFPPQKIEGKSYRDGGITDNVPVKTLYEIEKCNIIIVIHLNKNPSSHDISIDRERYANASLIEIWPKNYQGSLFNGTLDFVSQHAARRIDQGYNETIDLFRDIARCSVEASSSHNSTKAFAEKIASKINQNNEIYEKLMKITEKWETDKLIALQAECASLLREGQHRKIQISEINSLKDIAPQIVNNQYETSRVLMLIQQITIERIDLLQCEINALGIWASKIEAKADLGLYIQTCKDMVFHDGRKFTEIAPAEKILRIARDIAFITHGTEIIGEHTFAAVCRNTGLPEKIKLSEFMTSLDSSAVDVFINNDWDYRKSDISDIGKLIYVSSLFPDKIMLKDSSEIKCTQLCMKLYNDFINLAYTYQEEITPAIDVKIEARAFIPILERRSNPEFAELSGRITELYNSSKYKNKTAKYSDISQQCLDYIKSLCHNLPFKVSDTSYEIISLLKLNKNDIIVFHDDTMSSHKRGFAITEDGIYSYCNSSIQNRFISFEEFAKVKGFDRYFNRLDRHKRILAIGLNPDAVPVLPCQYIKEGSQKVIRFLENIRNACWVDLYLDL